MSSYIRSVLLTRHHFKQQKCCVCIRYHQFRFVIVTNPVVSFLSYVGLACFPTSDPIPGKSCAITGWGTLKSGGKQPDKLQVAHVPIIGQDDCKQKYKGEIHDSMVCAGYPEGGKDSCQGDSGGPMVCKGSDGRYSVHGVTSWGYGCAEPDKPGVYARVRFLLKWIKATTQTLHYCLAPVPL